MGEVIRRLLDEQDYKCAYTGVNLVLGVNAQLDHKTPIELGGSNDPSNLHWVDKEINRMKGKHSHNEFIQICQLIGSRGLASLPLRRIEAPTL
jgi:hypothetical protein